MKKYAVYPGYITSRTDGDRHFIGFDQLVRLYCLNPSECLNASDQFQLMGVSQPLIPIRPRYDGKYPLFERDGRQRAVRTSACNSQ